MNIDWAHTSYTSLEKDKNSMWPDESFSKKYGPKTWETIEKMIEEYDKPKTTHPIPEWLPELMGELQSLKETRDPPLPSPTYIDIHYHGRTFWDWLSESKVNWKNMFGTIATTVLVFCVASLFIFLGYAIAK
jgi:hypothetical protein